MPNARCVRPSASGRRVRRRHVSLATGLGEWAATLELLYLKDTETSAWAAAEAANDAGVGFIDGAAQSSGLSSEQPARSPTQNRNRAPGS